MAENNFSEILKETLQNEGGLNKNEVGRGGISNFGITQQTFDDFNKQKGLPSSSVESITPDVRDTIFREEFLERPKINQLHPDVRATLFDFGVQSGPSRAIKALQRAVGATEDGKVGPKTISATNRAIAKRGSKDVINDVVEIRSQFIEGLIGGNKVFAEMATGLRARIERQRKQ